MDVLKVNLKTKKPVLRSPDVPAHILSVSLNLFSTRGYFNTSIKDIVKATELSIGTIYHHFANKEGIVSALYHQILASMEKDIRQAIDSTDDPKEQCRKIIQLLFHKTESNPQLMSFVLHARHREFMEDEQPICSSKPFELMREAVKKGMADGSIREMDPIIASACLFGGPLRLIHLRLDGIIKDPLENHLDSAWKSAWRAVSA